MEIDYCEKIGDFCVTLIAPLNLQEKHTVRSIETSEDYKLKINMAQRIVTIKTFIDAVKTRSMELDSMSHHPADLSTVGVRIEDVNNLSLVLARIDGKQTRLGGSTLKQVSKEELELAKEHAKKFIPLARKITDKNASAEDVMTALNDDPSPTRSHKVLHTLLSSGGAMIADQELVLRAPDEVSESKHAINGHGKHLLRVDPINTFRDEREVEVKFMQSLSDCPLFQRDQQGRKTVKFKVPNPADLRILAMASSYGVLVDIEAQVNIVVTAARVDYNGVVIRILKKPDLLTALRRAQEADRGLFDDDAAL